ncbi:MAG: metalloregulator ArsR/SmtB family transcription factor [Reyranella sp.]|nr:metalloregulator ArsR/SmtB family transcription factor [Reyranella sp.]
MVEQNATALDRVFHALADPTRRAMLRRLADGQHSVGELAEPFDMSFAAAAKHVKVLEGAGLLSRTIEGRTHHCRLEARALAAADRWIAYYQRFWTGRLDALETALLQHARQAKTNKMKKRSRT